MSRGAPPATVRVATRADEPAVDALLGACYPPLLAPGYAPDLLARALPMMTKANPALLSCGTWYVASLPDAAGLAGCGGWTLQRPGRPHDPLDRELAHLRHFGVHPACTGRGVGRAIFDRCAEAAGAAGVRRFECYATLVAEGFYRALGFATVEAITVPMGEGVLFPGILMRRRL